MTLPYEHVPDVAPDSEPDPHWLEMRDAARSKLPDYYLPPAMPGPRPGWTRGAALLLIGIFFGATVCGVCLTYGFHP
jgi:hypothetical protein